MKLQIDTTNKIFKLEEAVNLKEFIELLDKLMPRHEWEQFKLEMHTVINNWTSPIVLPHIQPYDYPYRPMQPWYTISGFDQKLGYQGNLTPGIYNVEVTNEVRN